MSITRTIPITVRNRNFFLSIRIGEHKKKQLLKAIEFSQMLIPLKMKPKVMQKSIKLQQGLSTREVRSIIRASRAKKHRER